MTALRVAHIIYHLLISIRHNDISLSVSIISSACNSYTNVLLSYSDCLHYQFTSHSMREAWSVSIVIIVNDTLMVSVSVYLLPLISLTLEAFITFHKNGKDKYWYPKPITLVPSNFIKL